MEALDAVGTPASTAARAPRSSSRWAIAAGIVAVVAIAVLMFARRAEHTPPSTTSTATEKSLAVLPFASVGGDTANAYFAEGIADELTTALARLPGLRLAGRSSAARYKERGASAQEIAASLKVGAALAACCIAGRRHCMRRDASARTTRSRVRRSRDLCSVRYGASLN